MSWWGAQPPWCPERVLWDPSQATPVDQAGKCIVLLTVHSLTFRVSTDKLKSSLLFDLEVDRRPAWIAGNEQSLWCCSWMAGSPFFGQNRSQSVCFHAHSWCQYAVDVTECNDFSSFQFSLVTKGFGCQVMCSVQSLHQRPGWSALKVIN